MTCLDLSFTGQSRTYLVLVTEALVARDIALTIVDFDPVARVICAASSTDARSALTGLGSVEIAFIAACPTGFARSALHRDLVERHGHIILLGIEAEMAGPASGFDVLAQPFDTDAVVAKLRAGRSAQIPQLGSVSVEAKNIAWLTAEAT